MKPKLLLILAALALPCCATRSDPTFMNNAAAAMHGGMIASPVGVMMSPGLQNRNRPHPFFGAQ